LRRASWGPISIIGSSLKFRNTAMQLLWALCRPRKPLISPPSNSWIIELLYSWEVEVSWESRTVPAGHSYRVALGSTGRPQEQKNGCDYSGRQGVYHEISQPIGHGYVLLQIWVTKGSLF
jgi:hypothetical protein